MNPFLAGYRKFREEVYPRQAAKYRALAKTQRPHTLFITCSDSRVMPSAITQTEPGELFQCRIVGNLIPAHGNAPVVSHPRLSTPPWRSKSITSSCVAIRIAARCARSCIRRSSPS